MVIDRPEAIGTGSKEKQLDKVEVRLRMPIGDQLHVVYPDPRIRCGNVIDINECETLCLCFLFCLPILVMATIETNEFDLYHALNRPLLGVLLHPLP